MNFKHTILFIIFFLPLAGSAKSLYPKLFFEHGSVFDMQCPENPKRPITPEMKADLRKRLPEFQKIWDDQSGPLMNTLVEIFDRDFNRSEESFSLVLCGLMAPMSHPLVFRVRDYLKSTASEVKPDFYFVSEVFHEMLHRYITTNFPYDPSAAPSPLEKKYEKEDGGVRSHIFLLAIQKSIYLKLGRKAELDKIKVWDSEHAPSYKRAWEIVDKEGSDIFITDLKKQLPSKTPQ
ncbi:MAG: hypothetical protein JNL11_16445 [Bdellovibrionaceae bacterium]|nr:hypothetical protein [Pseudobdellovibrionaceae bacterium]